MNYYYMVKDGNILKYEITFDKEKLEKLKAIIIKECSLIIPKELDTIYPLKEIPDGEYRHISKTLKVSAAKESCYHYTYQEYHYPNLVIGINYLLEGNMQKGMAIILNPQELVFFNFKEKIKAKSQEIDNLNNIEDIKEKITKLKELNNLLLISECNKNQKEALNYYKDILNVVKMRLVNNISLQEIEKVTNFFEESLSMDLIRSLKKDRR